MADNNKITDTSKLTDAELKILEACLDPSLSGKTTLDKCKAINVSRDTWYKAFKKESFIQALNQANVELVKANVSDVVKATIKYAIGGARNSADRKLVLQMAGLHTDKVETSGEITTNNKIQFDDKITTEELREMMEKLNK